MLVYWREHYHCGLRSGSPLSALFRKQGIVSGKHDAYLELENFPCADKEKSSHSRASYFWPSTQSERKQLALLTEDHRGDPES